MSLWVDKYRPKSFDQLSYHNSLGTQLKALAASGDFPHILMYGPSGAGKKTRVMAILKELYGPGTEKIKIQSRVFQLSSSRKVEFNVVLSNYHIEITPSDMGNNDRVVIQDLLKEIAQTQSVDISAKNRFKVVVINEADSLTRDAQAALRRTMEKYSKNIRLILLSNTTSNIINPIKSRTLLIRVAAPTAKEIGVVISIVAKKEKIQLPAEEKDQDILFEKLAQRSHRNLRKALLMFQAMYASTPSGPVTADTTIPLPDWEVTVSFIATEISKNRSAAKLLEIRSILYDLIAHCIPPGDILKLLTLRLIDNVDPRLGPDLIEASAMYYHRLKQGSKHIFQLEACIAKFMNIIESYSLK